MPLFSFVFSYAIMLNDYFEREKNNKHLQVLFYHTVEKYWAKND